MPVLVRRILILALVLGVVGAGYAFTRGNGKGDKDKVTYESGTVTREDVRSFVSATGVIQPWKTVDVKSNVAGRIDRLYVDLGDVVKQGQPIADIDPTDTRTAWEQADADLRAAQAKKNQALANLDQEKAQSNAKVQSAAQSLANAQARLAEAKANARVQPSLTRLSVTQADASMVSAQKAVDQAKEAKQQYQEQLAQLQNVTIPLNVETVDSNL
ncbi:MAG TPA: biotin/lipoyl-binding protein, partial [Armatimonadota bacterium]|nr:biotin/lipoyl-binding protein [Armatimonadota bacterium]